MIPESTKKMIERNRNRVSACGAFKLFLPIPKRATVLVMDETFIGGTSIALSHHVEYVVCLCSNSQYAKFIQFRIRSLNIKNIYIVVGELSDVPFKKETFKIACLHGVKYSSSYSTFVLYFNEIRSIIKKGGIFYLSFELITTSIFTKLMKGVIKISVEMKLGTLDFKKLCTVQHYESFSNLHYVRIFKRNGIKRIREIYDNTKDKIKGDIAGYIFQKNSRLCDVESFKTLTQIIEADIAIKNNIKLRSGTLARIGSTGSLVVDYGSTIVRLPQSESAEKYCSRNYEMLKKLSYTDNSILTPLPITQGCVCGQLYYAESKIDGISLDNRQISLELIPHIIHQAYNLLINTDFTGCRSKDFVNQEIIESLFEIIGKGLIKTDSDILTKVSIEIKKLISINSLPLVTCHGDFKFSNFICSKNPEINFVGVIDWEFSSNRGLPLYDLITLLIWNGKERNDTEYRLAKRMWELTDSSIVDPLIYDYMEKLKINIELLKPITILSMITYLNNAFYQEIKDTECWYREMVTECLIPACKKFLMEI